MSKSEKSYPWNKSRDDDSGTMNDVYAGPEFFEGEGATECVYEGPEPESEPLPMEGVYAGPPMPEMMMCVYAGPEYFASKRDVAGMFVQTQPEERLMLCPACKRTVKKDSNFCVHCGARLPKEE